MFSRTGPFWSLAGVGAPRGQGRHLGRAGTAPDNVPGGPTGGDWDFGPWPKVEHVLMSSWLAQNTA